MDGCRTRFSKQDKLNILRAASLSKIPWLVHGFSTRPGGFSRAYGGHALNLGFTQHDSEAAVERNRVAFSREVTSGSWPLVTLRQVHSDTIRFVEAPSKPQLVGDGLVTSTPGLLLAIQTADCLPIILVDPKRHAVGVFHAGWRGTVKRIVEKGVGEMRRRFGTRPRDLKAAIGPGIHACCYQVGKEVREQFDSQFAYAESYSGRSKSAIRSAKNIPCCSSPRALPATAICRRRFFSTWWTPIANNYWRWACLRRVSKPRPYARIAAPTCCFPIAPKRADRTNDGSRRDPR